MTIKIVYVLRWTFHDGFWGAIPCLQEDSRPALDAPPVGREHSPSPSPASWPQGEVMDLSMKKPSRGASSPLGAGSALAIPPVLAAPPPMTSSDAVITSSSILADKLPPGVGPDMLLFPPGGYHPDLAPSLAALMPMFMPPGAAAAYLGGGGGRGRGAGSGRGNGRGRGRGQGRRGGRGRTMGVLATGRVRSSGRGRGRSRVARVTDSGNALARQAIAEWQTVRTITVDRVLC